MAGRHQNRSFPLPGVQSSGQVHAFGNCSDNDMLEEDAEMYELRSRGKEKVRRSTSRDRLDDIIVLTKDIQEGDTLNAIALQYCCTLRWMLVIIQQWTLHIYIQKSHPHHSREKWKMELCQLKEYISANKMIINCIVKILSHLLLNTKHSN
ncbi:lysM and putative peptidoglycan-binding domain-containing protein 3 isoform X2 [Macaca fascicularis]|uniref:lysM and putative peptidoglycan-binding domain-containing protein 3 isoform X2 n=1 Tax=Macaca fascicularis TaxID=9541 RepID=UPI003D15D824